MIWYEIVHKLKMVKKGSLKRRLKLTSKNFLYNLKVFLNNIMTPEFKYTVDFYRL